MESRPPPNLTDPAELAAYRTELRGLARGVRYGGVSITVLGAVLAGLRQWLWPQMTVLLPMVTIALGVMLMLTAIALRAAYHARRMRGG